MIDDLGAGWVDYDGSNAKINTPNLERMAKEGMVFTQAYAAASVCSPTRAACITGMSPGAIKLTAHIPGKGEVQRRGPKGGPKDAAMIYHLPLNLPSYARELKKQGYATGFIGKWHLAGAGSIKTEDGVVNAKWHPEKYGFDVNIGGCAYGQPKSWFDPYRNATIADREKGEYLTDRLADEAAAFIRANKDKPFHLSFWPYTVHKPIRAPKHLVEKNGGDRFLAMLEAMDNAVGTVITALEETGNYDNTMLIFYSDNGGDFPTKGLADKKASLLEGGVRVPMVVTWPKVIKGGTTSDVPVNSMDFFPTFVHAAGGATDSIKRLEGLDLMPLFEGESKFDRDALYWHFPHNRMDASHYMGATILEDNWKFYKGFSVIPDALYNLADDPMERNNVIKQHPKRVRYLQGKLINYLRSIDAELPPGVTMESLKR